MLYCCALCIVHCTVIVIVRSTWQWNWPAIPDVKKVEGAQQIHTALLVLYCSAAEEIDKTVAEETEYAIY